MNWSARLYLWACERLYHELAWGYDLVSWLVSLGRWGRWRGAARQYLCDADGRLRQNVLEIGFGTGELLAQLTQAATDSGEISGQPASPPAQSIPTGLELSPAMHKVTSAKFRRRQLYAPRVQAFAQQMPFANGVFDAVVSTFPAPYIFDPQTLQECARVLRPAPGGQLLIVGMWVALNVGWLARLGLPFYGRPHPTWMRQAAQRLAQAGFAVTFDEVRDGAFTVGVIRGQKQA
ncbi:MAG: methyltransferase domain-containing protein [Caldilineaceae bacterium]